MIHSPIVRALIVPSIYLILVITVSIVVLREAALSYLLIDVILTSVFFSIPWLTYRGIQSLKKEPKQAGEKTLPFMVSYARVLTLISAVGFLVMIIFAYEYGVRSTARLPIYSVETASGSRVTFVSMAHIGSDRFYQSVQDRVIDTLKKDNGLVMYEGVTRTSTGDLMISKVLPDDLGDIYDAIAVRGGLVSQTESNTLILGDQTIRVDTTLEEMDRRYSELRGSGDTLPPPPPLMSPAERAAIESIMTPKSTLHADLIALLIRSFLSFSIRELGGNGVEAFAQGDPHLAQIVIHDRDQIVARAIEGEVQKEILVIYGALHVSGIIKELQKNDPNIKAKYLESVPLF